MTVYNNAWLHHPSDKLYGVIEVQGKSNCKLKAYN